MNNKIFIRKLTINDVTEYKAIRLELLKNEPSSFGSSFEEEDSFDFSMWTNRLTKKNISAFGAFNNNELVGIVLGVMNPRKKIKHIATLNSMYVKPEYRSQGIGEKLIVKTVTYLFEQSIEIINLSDKSIADSCWQTSDNFCGLIAKTTISANSAACRLLFVTLI